MTILLNRTILFILFIVSIIYQGCGDKIFGGDDDRLLIINNSDKAVYVGTQTNYPDTLINNYNPSGASGNYNVLSNSKKRLHSRSWPQLVVQSIFDTMMIFIYDAHTLETTPWDTVRKNYMVLKRYDLSLDDLEKMNWTITYPK